MIIKNILYIGYKIVVLYCGRCSCWGKGWGSLLQGARVWAAAKSAGALPFVGRTCNSEARFAISGRLLTSLSPAGSRTVLVIFRTARLMKKVGPGHTLSIKDINVVQRSAWQKRSPKNTEQVCYVLVVSIMFLFTLLHCRKTSKYTLHCMILLPSFFCVHPKGMGCCLSKGKSLAN